MNTTRPMFQTAGQALHFAWAITAHEASPKSQMSVVIERLMRELGIWRHDPQTVFFDGLNPLEVRGQCAMIRKSVDVHCSAIQAAAVKASYAIDQDRARAVAVLASVYGDGGIAASALAWRSVSMALAQRAGLSLRAIEEGTGVARSTLGEQQKRMEAGIRSAVAAAICVLEPVFADAGIIEGVAIPA